MRRPSPTRTRSRCDPARKRKCCCLIWLDAPICLPQASHRKTSSPASGFAAQGKKAGVFVLFYEPKPALVARIDAREREIDEDVGGAELAVDHRAVADAAARPHIALEQRRQAALALARLDRVLGH